MSDKDYVTLQELVDTLNVEVVHGEDYLDKRIYSSEVSRPGLILTGYIDDYSVNRLQIIGQTEIRYLEGRPSSEIIEMVERMCRENTPAIIFARNMDIPEEFVEVAAKKKVPILRTPPRTSRAIANITNFLGNKLAPRISRHGVFVEVFGLGVLITGASGVGKSEVALELVHRGHRLIADDRVEFFMVDELTLIGEAPKILENMLEIRGVGIVDVMSLYGVSAIRRSKRLELIIELVIDDGNTEWDRLGTKELTEQIFEVTVPKIKIPVKLGRNLSTIIETAAMNFRADRMGYNAAETFNNRLTALIEENAKREQEDEVDDNVE